MGSFINVVAFSIAVLLQATLDRSINAFERFADSVLPKLDKLGPKDTRVKVCSIKPSCLFRIQVPFKQCRDAGKGESNCRPCLE